VGYKDASFDTGPKPTLDDLVGYKDASFETGLKPTRDDLVGDKHAPFDTGPKPTRDDLAGYKDASFESGPKPTRDDLVGDKHAPFDTGPKPTRDDLVGHKEASFETDADIVGVRALDEESFKWLESSDDSTAWKIDATVEVPKEEIDEFSGQFQVMDTPEPLDDALWLDDKAGGLWATGDTVLEPLDDPQAFDAGADGALDF
jgi:hypothetical protein